MHLAHLVKQVDVDYVFMTKILLIAWKNRQGIIIGTMKLKIFDNVFNIILPKPCQIFSKNLIQQLI